MLYRARPRIIADSADLQARLLDRAAEWVKPGGSLVYAVCSLEPEEGEAQIDAFLARQPTFRIVPAEPAAPGIEAHTRGWLRILPGLLEKEGGLDGFFTAYLVRSAS